MVKPLHVLTVVMLTIHLMMGCCWHHAHGGHEGTPTSVDHLSATDAAPSCPDDLSNHGSRGCYEPPCSFVASGRPVVNAMTVSWCSQAVLGVLLNDSSSTEDFSASSRRLLAVDRPSLPVRLHLANQVLLI